MKSLLGRAKECLLVFYYTRILGLRKIYAFDIQKFGKDNTSVFRLIASLNTKLIFCEFGHRSIAVVVVPSDGFDRKHLFYTIDEKRVCCMLDSFKSYVADSAKVVVFAKVKILDTPNGRLLVEMMEDPEFELTFGPRMIKNVAGEYTGIITFDVVNPEQ